MLGLQGRRIGIQGALVTLALVACERGPPPEPPSPVVNVDRVFIDRTWDTVFVAGGLAEDTLFFEPGVLRSGRGRVVFYDFGDSRIKSLDSDGNLVWAFGRRGEGPGEFLNAWDLQITANGDVWIADSNNARITILTEAGEQREIFGFPHGYMIQRLVTLRDDTLALPQSAERQAFWIDLDRTAVTGSGAIPDSVLATRHSYYQQSLIDIAPDNRRWGAVFGLADRFLIYDGRAPVCTGKLVKGTLPRFEVEPGQLPSIWAAGAFWTDSTFVILARDRDQPGDLRTLDEFDATCGYLRSYSIPVRAVGLTWDAGVLYLAFEEPAPGILALRW